MVLLLDQMAQRYGLLPTECLTRATTLDMVIMDMSLTYEHHQHEKSKPGYVPDVDVETLLAIKEQAK
jgi:hypothetical protein